MSQNAADEVRHLARSAARWLALIESGTATDDDHARLAHWRGASSTHEAAWQKAQALKMRFAGLPSELAMASLDRPQVGRRSVVKGVLGISALIPAVWLTGRQLPLDAWQADFSTAVGERRHTTLHDGSILHLNTETAVNLDATQRRLTLVRGEVGVQRTASTPFIINTVGGQATFHAGDVCVRQVGETCEFSVFAGEVDVHSTQFDAVTLTPGQRLRTDGNALKVLDSFDIERRGWRQGVIVANDQPLGEFLRELDRYRPGIMRWDPALERLRITGSFVLDDTDRILRLLAASLPLEVRTYTRYWVSLLPKDRMG